MVLNKQREFKSGDRVSRGSSTGTVTAVSNSTIVVKWDNQVRTAQPFSGRGPFQRMAPDTVQHVEAIPKDGHGLKFADAPIYDPSRLARDYKPPCQHDITYEDEDSGKFVCHDCGIEISDD